MSYNKLLPFENETRDPMGSIASSFKPKLPASSGAELVTSPVRFHLDTALFKAFDEDQVEEYKSQLISEGRWRLPNDGGLYTIRFNYLDIPEVFDFSELARAKWYGPGRSRTSDTEYFLDFDMDGEQLIRCTDVARKRFAGLNLEQKKIWAENPGGLTRGGLGYDLTTASVWWEPNSWLVHRCDHEGEPVEHSMLAQCFLDVLVISLMDRSVVRAITGRPKPSKKWLASGLAHPEQDVQEITIYCPGRVVGGDGSGSHASPRSLPPVRAVLPG